MKSATDSPSCCEVWRKSWAASSRLLGSRRLCIAAVTSSRDFFSRAVRSPHSCKARPRRWPASWIRVSCSLQSFHSAARSNPGIQSSNKMSDSPSNGSTGGALPLREVLSPLAPWLGDAEAEVNHPVVSHALSAGRVPSSRTAGVGQSTLYNVVRVAIPLGPPPSQEWEKRASLLLTLGGV